MRNARQSVLALAAIDQRLGRLAMKDSKRDVQQLQCTVRRLIWLSAKEYARLVRHYREDVLDRLDIPWKPRTRSH
ncbi:MAG TPA: hypothetical protein VLY04_20565 [Bryobacteraceae bacterium]|nr:hypothetical protein [Bryobacteraceae bacterium]